MDSSNSQITIGNNVGSITGFQNISNFHSIQTNAGVPVVNYFLPLPLPDPRKKEVHELSQALTAFSVGNFWTQQPGTHFTPWSSKNKKLKISIGSGSGQQQSKFSVSLDEFLKLCIEIQFSAPFLRKLMTRCSMFEYHFASITCNDKARESPKPKILEIAISNYENDSFTLLLRYNMRTHHARAILFLKTQDALRGREALTIRHFTDYLTQHASTLETDPFLLTSLVLAFFQYQYATDYARWRYDLYDMESRLGVTARAAVFEQAGYEGVSFDYDTLNARLAWLSARAADTALSAATIREHGAALLRLSGLLEEETEESGSSFRRGVSMRKEEIQTTILRSDLYLKNSAMVDATLNSMRAVLYNRITKHDSDSMKTIAVVTLFFLPGTFVSSIFSTGIFNFFANKAKNERTVSSLGWVYLLTCLILTGGVLCLWVTWYRWGGLWLEKVHLKRAYKSEGRSQSCKGLVNVSGGVERGRGKDVEKGEGTESSSNDTPVKEEEDLVTKIERISKAVKESEGGAEDSRSIPGYRPER